MKRFPLEEFDALHREKFMVPPALKPWEWAEKNIDLPARASPIRGAYRTDQWAYVREPLEAFADPEIRTITLCWSAQSTKTMTATVMVLYSIANDPGDVIFARPSLTMAKRFSQKRLIPLIDHNKVLSVHKTSDRYDFKKCELILENMAIFLTGANPNQLSGETVRRAFLDETDKYEEYDSDKAEADLVSLAFERMKFVKDSKGVLTSTPTVPAGTIWRWFLKGDQRRFYVPCPYCLMKFKLTWDRVKWPKVEDVELIKRETVVECPHCSKPVKERHKYEMILAGEWAAENPGADRKDRSYQLAETYTTTRWGDLAVKWIAANESAKVGLLGPLHNFVNSSLAEVWDPTERQSRKDSDLRGLCDSRARFEVPAEGVLGITAGIDTQDLGFWYVIRAWGRDLESWKLADGYAESLATILKMIADGDFRDSAGRKYAVNLSLIDSGGHRTDEVYDFCRKNFRFRPSKGVQRAARQWQITKVDKYPDGKELPGGLKLVLVNTTYYKDTVLAKTQLEPESRGAFHLDAETSEDYYRHMIAEYRDEKGVWRCPSGKRNDLWDCEVLSLCAADMLGIRYWSKPRSIIKSAPGDRGGGENPTDSKPNEPQKKEKKPAPSAESVGRKVGGNPFIRRFE